MQLTQNTNKENAATFWLSNFETCEWNLLAHTYLIFMLYGVFVLRKLALHGSLLLLLTSHSPLIIHRSVIKFPLVSNHTATKVHLLPIISPVIKSKYSKAAMPSLFITLLCLMASRFLVQLSQGSMFSPGLPRLEDESSRESSSSATSVFTATPLDEAPAE